MLVIRFSWREENDDKMDTNSINPWKYILLSVLGSTIRYCVSAHECWLTVSGLKLGQWVPSGGVLSDCIQKM
jgi:hypothetical protein